MRRRLLFAALLVILPAVALAASTLPASATRWPLAILEPGSLLVLGLIFLILAAVAQRMLAAGHQSETEADTTG